LFYEVHSSKKASGPSEELRRLRRITVYIRIISAICGFLFFLLLCFDLGFAVSVIATLLWFIWIIAPWFGVVTLTLSVPLVLSPSDEKEKKKESEESKKESEIGDDSEEEKKKAKEEKKKAKEEKEKAKEEKKKAKEEKKKAKEEKKKAKEEKE